MDDALTIGKIKDTGKMLKLKSKAQGNRTDLAAGLNNDLQVELMVIETTTSSMRTKRSTN